MGKRNLLIIFIALIVLVIGFFFASSLKDKKQKSNNLQVSASFYPLYYFASQIGGRLVDVSNITPAGAEPHDYDPTAKDLAKIETGDILILNGTVEGWGPKIRENLNGTDVKVITAGEGLLTKSMINDGKKQTDPHIWLDPIKSKEEVAKITAGFIEKDPNNKYKFETNQKLLNQKLDSLDQKYKMGLANCLKSEIVTSHAAFGYLASRYGLNQIAISGLSPDAEPSAKQIASVAQYAKKHNVKYIFFESLVSPKLSETVANEIGAKTLVLDPIEGIGDNDIKQGKNYFTVMENNLKNLREALQCN